MTTHLKIAIAESSAIIRNGLEVTLKRMNGFHVQFIEVPKMDTLMHTLRMYKPDVLIINPSIPGFYSSQNLKEESGCHEMVAIALLYHITDSNMLRGYDESIGIFDSLEEIRTKFDKLFTQPAPTKEDNEEQQTLSVREKEIVVCVVKGMTNREIADKLFLSTHTVITHRRNIARKLQIHSASGLTIYAIVNKLVELEEIQTPPTT
ncbi:response regulator transcription factor [Parabacteroides sp. OttesenSCG-928-N08]|nr:response regulator transcription factor [Parabacteroides sp. OttesenSCG-928-N08]